MIKFEPISVFLILKIVDTPGFGDSSGRDNQLISEMMEVLKDTLGYCNAIVLAIDGNTPRFTSGLTDMLKQMSSIFGEKWWDYMIVGVTKWPYDQVRKQALRSSCELLRTKDSKRFKKEQTGYRNLQESSGTFRSLQEPSRTACKLL